MKRAIILFLTMTIVRSFAFTQNTLLVYTKFPLHLNFIDLNNSTIEKKAIWSEEEGGYIINVENVEKTYVQSNDDATFFKLSDQERVTKLIALPSNDKLSLEQCFSSEKYCCEKLTDKQRKSTEKIFAIAVMKKDAQKVEYFSFTQPSHQFLKNEDITFNWTSNAEIQKAYIVDVESLDIVYESTNVETNSFTLPNDIKTLEDSKYQFAIEFKEPQYKKQTIDFSIQDVAFTSMEYYLPSQKTATISWKSTKPIENICVINTKTKNVIYEKKENCSSLPLNEIEKSLSVDSQYSLIVKCDNKKYSFDFEILVDNNSVKNLTGLIDE